MGTGNSYANASSGKRSSGSGMFSKVMDSYNASKGKAQDQDVRRFEAVAGIVRVGEQGRQERKTLKKKSKYEVRLEETKGTQSRTTSEHNVGLAERLLSNPNTGGRTTTSFRADGAFDLGTTKSQEKKTRTTAAKPASGKPAAAPVAYNAKNPHPNNPWDVKTHRTEFVKYNKGTSVERGQSMKRFKAMGPK